MKKKLVVLGGMIMGAAPVLALAQPGVVVSGTSTGTCNLGTQGNLFGVLCQIGRILNAVVPVLIALGVVFFVYGVITFVIASDEEAKKSGRDRIVFGIIGLAVIIGLWGLVSLLRNTFALDNSPNNIELPTFPVNINQNR